MADTRSGPVVAAACGYLLGTLPSADVASRLAGGPDLRHAGSRNPGGANAAAVLGKRWGYSVMAVDVVKGVVAACVGRSLGGAAGSHIGATAAVVGHCYPVWTGFRGGKGVATAVGQSLATFPAGAPLGIAGAVFARAIPSERRAFAATSAACVCWVSAAMVWWRRGVPNLWGTPPTLALPMAAAASSAIIIRRFATAYGGNLANDQFADKASIVSSRSQPSQ